MISAARAGQAVGVTFLVVVALLVARSFRDPGPTTDLWPGEIILDALDRSTEACLSRDSYMTVIAGNPMQWSERPPLNCTDAPADADWITIRVEDRVRHYAFGPDGCRIAFAEVACP